MPSAKEEALSGSASIATPPNILLTSPTLLATMALPQAIYSTIFKGLLHRVTSVSLKAATQISAAKIYRGISCGITTPEKINRLENPNLQEKSLSSFSRKPFPTIIKVISGFLDNTILYNPKNNYIY